MGEHIEIEGGSVRLFRTSGQEKVLDRAVSLKAFLQTLPQVTPESQRLPVLPIGTRWVLSRGSALILTVEQPPQVRRFAWRPKGYREAREYSLAFPYILYLLVFSQGSFEEMRIYYRTAPLTSEEDLLSLSNLWNVSATETPMAKCRACLRGRPIFEDLSLAGQVQTTIEFFWGTGFNLQIDESCFQRAAKRDERIATLEAWEATSRKDPLFPLEVDWESTGMSLRGAAEGLLTWRGTPTPIEDAADLADLMYRVKEG